MKYLDKFLNYIKESHIDDLSNDDLSDMLLPLTDLGFTYTISEPMSITEGKFEGRTSRRVMLSNTFEVNNVDGLNGISDKRVWDFLQEIVIFKEMLDSDLVTFGITSGSSGNLRVYINFVQRSKVDDNLFKLQKLYSKMVKRKSQIISDFANTMYSKLYEDELKIVIKCGGSYRNMSGKRVDAQYTDRKWNNLFGSIDFSEFNVEKDITEQKILLRRTGDKEVYKVAEITITVKK